MRLVFMGTAEFAVPSLRSMAECIELVVSQPDRPSGRGMHLRPSPVKDAAVELGLPVETPEKCRAPEFVALLQTLKPDALLVAAYGQILSQSVLDTALHGGINLHGSILPKFRGAAPIQRAILDGERETGVSLMQMDKGMDTGDIIAIERTLIDADETYGELQARLAILAAQMSIEWMPRIVEGDYPRTQQDSERATMAPKVSREETELDFARTANEEYNRFRAFTPFPGASVQTPNGPLKITAARLGSGFGTPGQVLCTSPELEVAFANQSLLLLEVQPSGKKRMSGRDYANGVRLASGMSLLPLM